MKNHQVDLIAKKIFSSVFDKNIELSLQEIKTNLAFDIPTVEKVKCSLSDQDTYIFFSGDEKIASQKAVISEAKKTQWMREKRKISSVEDILRYWQEINYITAEKSINSSECYYSDGIYNSRRVFYSASIFSSENIIFGYKINDSSFMLACRDSGSSSFCIRVNDSLNCSNSFEVSWSYKISRCFFIHDSANLYECMFCSHIYSRRYCIANMQFEKQEYFEIKKLVVDWILQKIKN